MTEQSIHKTGFTDDTPFDEAVSTAVANAREICANDGYTVVGEPVEVSRMDSGDHRANGEYLVRVVLNRTREV